MSSEKLSSRESVSSKVKRSAKSLTSKPSNPKKLKSTKVTPRSRAPELSVVNVIERISQMLRKEAHELERKRVSGE